jgi:ABC-type nitrate/sulfonate/bicarbonate transport system permease component
MATSTLSPKRVEQPTRPKISKLRSSPTAWRLAVILAFLLAWEVLASVGLIDENFVSKPSAILQAAGTLVVSPKATTAIGETLLSVSAAFTLGTGLGIVAGVAMGLQPLLRAAYFPVVMLLLGTPKSVFLPVFVLFFGLGGTSAVAFGTLLASVHVIVNVVAGVDLIETKHREVARAFRASTWQRFVHVIIPGASPGIFTALWHGLRNSFVGVVVAELFASTSGIGSLVRIYSNNFQTAEALALVLTISLAIILVGTAWNRVEARLTRWRPREDTI